VSDTAKKTSADAVKAHQNIAGAFDVPDASEGLKKITSTLEELHKQVDTFGQSDGQKKLYDLLHGGATGGQIAEAEALEKQLETLKQQADVTKQLAELQKQSRQAGLDEAGKKVDDLQSLGATSAQIAAAQAYQSHIEAVTKAKEDGKKLDEEAKRYTEEALTPLQKEQEKIEQINKLYAAGKLTAEQAQAAKAKAEKELHGEEKNSQKAVTRGSEAAFSLMNEINKRINGGGSKDDLAKKQLAVAEKVPHLLDRLIEKVSGQAKLSLASLGI
jgi:hypothetical protein